MPVLCLNARAKWQSEKPAIEARSWSEIEFASSLSMYSLTLRSVPAARPPRAWVGGIAVVHGARRVERFVVQG